MNLQKPKRQVWVGVVVAVLGTFTVANAVYQEQRTDQAIACFERNFADLTLAVTSRSDATAEVNAAEDDIFDELLSALEARPDSPGQASSVARLTQALVERKAASADLRQQRSQLPYPDYPEGTCTP